MKRGDIFQVGAGEQLYYADAIAPNGGVYALPYDPQTGRGKQVTLFKTDTEFQVLYNNQKTPPNSPEPEPLKFEEGWDYCKIGQKREEVAPYAYETRWVAQTIGSTQTVVGKSREISYEWRDGQENSVKPETAAKWRQDLVDELMAQGWQVLDGQYEGYLRCKQ